jgi:hypothetical protein
MHRLFSLHIAPVSRMMAQDSSGWTPGWTETRSRSYGLKEDQVQMLLNQPGPGEQYASSVSNRKPCWNFSKSVGFLGAQDRLVQYSG